jgi:hypothetical protein
MKQSQSRMSTSFTKKITNKKVSTWRAQWIIFFHPPVPRLLILLVVLTSCFLMQMQNVKGGHQLFTATMCQPTSIFFVQGFYQKLAKNRAQKPNTLPACHLFQMASSLGCRSLYELATFTMTFYAMRQDGLKSAQL